MNLCYFVLAVFAIGMAFLWRVVHSPLARSSARSTGTRGGRSRSGYSVARYKLAAFVLSAGVAGLAGATKVFVFQLASLSDVELAHVRARCILMTLLGGLGTFAGPAVGAAVILGLDTYLLRHGGADPGHHRRDVRRLRSVLPTGCGRGDR